MNTDAVRGDRRLATPAGVTDDALKAGLDSRRRVVRIGTRLTGVMLAVALLALLAGTAAAQTVQPAPAGPTDTTTSAQSDNAATQQSVLPSVTRVVRPDTAGLCAANTSNELPAFTSGEMAIICLSGALPPDTTSVDASVGQKAAVVTQVAGTSLAAILPEVVANTDAPLTVRVNGTTLRSLTPTIRQYIVPQPIINQVFPTDTTAGSRIRLSGDGLAAPPKQVKVQVGEDVVTTERVASDGTWIVAVLPPAMKEAGEKPVSVSVWGVPATPAERPLALKVRQVVSATDTAITAALALAPAALVVVLVVVLQTLWRRRVAERKGQNPPGVVGAVLIEPETNTYSLSRAQFYWWLLIVAYAYAFVFVGKARVEGTWAFPPLSTFLLTLIVSLATLAGAQITSGLKGNKGTGLANPSASDLIMHGGVIAPERVQQLLWTIIGGLGFLAIVIQTYHTSASLPEIPGELLTLMGLSGIAYVGGKALRAPGPKITQVAYEPSPDGKQTSGLTISGEKLAANAQVWIDQAEVPLDKVVAKSTPQNGFVTDLWVPVTFTRGQWGAEDRMVVVQNPDAQRSEYPVNKIMDGIVLVPESEHASNGASVGGNHSAPPAPVVAAAPVITSASPLEGGPEPLDQDHNALTAASQI